MPARKKKHPSFDEGLALLFNYLNSIHHITLALQQSLSEGAGDFFTNDKIVKRCIQGIVCTEAYFIVKGYARCYFTDEKNQEHTFGLFGEKEIVVSEESFFNQIPSTFNIEFGKDTYVIVVKMDFMAKVFESFEEANLLCIRVLSLYKRKELGRDLMLRMVARDAYAVLCKRFPFTCYLKGQDIASYLGITESTLSRVRSNKRQKINISSTV